MCQCMAFYHHIYLLLYQVHAEADCTVQQQVLMLLLMFINLIAGAASSNSLLAAILLSYSIASLLSTSHCSMRHRACFAEQSCKRSHNHCAVYNHNFNRILFQQPSTSVSTAFCNCIQGVATVFKLYIAVQLASSGHQLHI